MEADQRDVTIEEANTVLDALTATDGDSQLATARKADRKPRGKDGDAEGAEKEVATDSAAGDEDLDAMLES